MLECGRGEWLARGRIIQCLSQRPRFLFLQNVDRSLVTLLTIVQWATITAFASMWARKWRSYEAIAFTTATILVTGIVSIACLLLLGYRLPFEGM